METCYLLLTGEFGTRVLKTNDSSFERKELTDSKLLIAMSPAWALSIESPGRKDTVFKLFRYIERNQIIEISKTLNAIYPAEFIQCRLRPIDAIRFVHVQNP
jgi:hypothetical protein